MRKKQIIVLLIVLAFINVGVISLALTSTAQSSDRYVVFDGKKAIDATPDMMGADEIALRKHAAEVGSVEATQASPVGELVAIGEEFNVTVSDYGLDIDYEETFVVLMDGLHGIICIDKDAYDNYDPVTDEYVFENPEWPVGGWAEEDRISTAQFAYLLDEFDNNIYPTVGEVFGEPAPRGAEGRKVWILIFNIRDEPYYDGDIDVYTVGYFSAGTSAEENKNVMHIDTYNWQDGAGPGTIQLYEGAFCHEFEHLVHFDQDPDEPSWVDEGFADLSAFLCGYGHFSGHIDEYLFWHFMTSLTFWGSGLEDYGASYLFALYLYEQFGGAEFISALCQEQANGIEGIEKTLTAFGFKVTFDEIFDAWTIANYIDDTRKAGGKYGYETLDIGSEDTLYGSIETYLELIENIIPGLFPEYQAPFTIDQWSFQYLFFGYNPQPYTANYFRFTNTEDALVWIDGADYSGVTAHSGTYEWYSGAEAWAWRSIDQSFSLPSASEITLEFYTYFEIEGDWDYGYVEVQCEGEWYTLNNTNIDYYMTTHVAHPQDNTNCPDGREPTDYEAAGRWFAFTDYSNGYMQASMDLTAFAGKNIDLYFTLWQDGAFTLQNMYLDDISIVADGSPIFFDDVEAGEDGWTTTGWYITDGMFENGWSVTVIDTKFVPGLWDPMPTHSNAMQLHQIKHMDVDPLTQSGSMHVSESPIDSGRMKVAIVSNRAPHIISSTFFLGVEI